MSSIDFLRRAGAALALIGASLTSHAAQPVTTELTPDNSVLLLIDYQPQFVFSTHSTSIDTLVNNAVALTEAAQVFKVPTLITTVTAQNFGGPTLPQIQAAAPNVTPVDRAPINPWQDNRVRDFVHKSGRKKLILAGLWTDNCVMLPALSALAEGYEVYVVTDASGDADAESHERAVQRLVQAGAVPITWLPVALEWQADWSHADTSGQLVKIMAEHTGAINAGAFYLRSMKHPSN